MSGYVCQIQGQSLSSPFTLLETEHIARHYGWPGSPSRFSASQIAMGALGLLVCTDSFWVYMGVGESEPRSSISSTLPIGPCLQFWLVVGRISLRGHLWADSSGYCKRVGWTSHGEQANKQHPAMVSASAPVSRFLAWLPSVMNCDVEAK